MHLLQKALNFYDVIYNFLKDIQLYAPLLGYIFENFRILQKKKKQEKNQL